MNQQFIDYGPFVMISFYLYLRSLFTVYDFKQQNMNIVTSLKLKAFKTRLNYGTSYDKQYVDNNINHNIFFWISIC